MEIKYNLKNYSQCEAYNKIDLFLDGLVSQYKNMISNPKKKWNDEKDYMDFGFEAMGFNIKGDIKLQGKELILNGRLPLLARVYSGRIEKIIKGKLEELLPKRD